MKWHYVHTIADNGEAHNAGAKAPADVSAILAKGGFSKLELRDVPNREKAGTCAKLAGHHAALRHWLDAIADLESGDGIIMQVPFASHTIFFGKVISQLERKGIKLVLLIHDLESVRLGLTGDVSFAQARRFGLEESALFSYAHAIIVHNDHMAEFVSRHLGYPRHRIVSLGLFDYLVRDFRPRARPADGMHGVAVAGNLRRDKAGYLYDIPNDVDFIYYGDGYEVDSSRKQAVYKGSYPADILPSVIEGGFGLVWDGPVGSTCSGVYGTYLTINNPHKASLYLASDLPIITWKYAAIADIVRREGVGLCLESLYQLHDALDTVSERDYSVMLLKAQHLGGRLRSGMFTMEAVQRACALAEGYLYDGAF